MYTGGMKRTRLSHTILLLSGKIRIVIILRQGDYYEKQACENNDADMRDETVISFGDRPRHGASDNTDTGVG